MFFDDLPVGFVHETGSTMLSEAEIIAFAEQYDPQPFHTDPVAAEDSIYGGLIASGFQTMTVAFDLVLKSKVWTEASMGSPGMDEVRWKLPVRPGDSLRVRMTVTKSEPSTSRPDRGRTTIFYEILNQRDEVVSSYYVVQLLRRNT
ncbi:MaoC family dehydratase [Alisedimentitalea sp. MJ-SS2]|uniref:MaoC family dehydratase n=1 Tax=Aliisedimentitalea sp. MJ-SS2 TaxID=3049795 RepID=UPI00290ABBC9|nr:MaoC family dehydratase [Alisedimentitalea sp. MJ-SS2]MDU8929973.1 MaoC family dehydratase [Alisedimentitalea sp. MJ-SS2]